MDLAVGLAHWRLVGGSERYAREIVAALAARGHSLTVLYGDGEPEPLPGVSFRHFEPLADPAAPPAGRSALAGLLAGAAPDLVLQLTSAAEWIVETELAAAPFVRFVQDHTLFCPAQDKMLADGTPCRAPLGAACKRSWLVGPGCNGIPPRRRTRAPRARLAERRRDLALHERAALLLVASEYMRGELVGAGLEAARIAVLPYSTRAATGAIEPVPAPADTLAFLARASGPLIFTPARLVLPDKGVDHLLTALALVRRPFRAVIAGEGPAREWLEEKARAEGLAGRVHFAGWLDEGAVEWLHARADVVAFPSVWDEPFGLAGIEALAHGTPVVAFEVGGVPEWLAPGVGGLLVPRADVAAFARALTMLLADPDLARLIGAAGRRRVERAFRPPRHVERLEALLGAALGPRTGRREIVRSIQIDG